MWKYIPLLLLAFGVAACHSSQKATATDRVVAESYALPDSLSVSPAFGMFWNDWNRELQQAEVALADYTPSEELAQRYLLRQDRGVYYLNGFLHTNVQFNALSLTALGGHCVAYGEGIYTFSIPVRELPRLVALPGIVYIESASPAHLRRP